MSGDGLRVVDEQPAEHGESAMTLALLNILDDLAEERTRLEAASAAHLNILEDFVDERSRLLESQRALLNILTDYDDEAKNLGSMKSALLNILEDVAATDVVEQLNREMKEEIAERIVAEAELRRAKERVDEANRELEAFSYSVAHDLRAPLRSIDGFSQALVEDFGDKIDADCKTFLDYIRESAQQMAQLIDGLLELSRIGRTPLRRVRCDLTALAESVVTRFRRIPTDRVVEVDVEQGLECEGDERLLRIVLENLIGNAWKFTGKQSEARIEFGREVDGAEMVFFVRDNGAGFDMAYVDKLFGVFQRLHSTREFDGTGIGLATVQRIIHRHGGRVKAEGETGRGATFRFSLGEST